jgi:hypothetical protein
MRGHVLYCLFSDCLPGSEVGRDSFQVPPSGRGLLDHGSIVAMAKKNVKPSSVKGRPDTWAGGMNPPAGTAAIDRRVRNRWSQCWNQTSPFCILDSGL